MTGIVFAISLDTTTCFALRPQDCWQLSNRFAQRPAGVAIVRPHSPVKINIGDQADV